jgi:hypothetical protein
MSVNLDKTNPVCGMCMVAPAYTRPDTAPRYPLYGHRDGLRRNDLITLASAFWIEANGRNASAQAMAMSQPDPDGN